MSTDVTFLENVIFCYQPVASTKVEENEWLVYSAVTASIEKQNNISAETTIGVSQPPPRPLILH